MWSPGGSGVYDFTHFTPSPPGCRRDHGRGVPALAFDLVSAEETSSQIETAFLAALDEEQLTERIDVRLMAALLAGAIPAELDGPEVDGVPVLIAMGDNGPQMRSHSTKE